MEILAHIAQRRAVYPASFTGAAVERSALEQLLEAANYAPTHRRTEPWRFVVFEQGKLGELGQALRTACEADAQAKGQEASAAVLGKIERNTSLSGAVIALIMQRDPQARIPEWEEVAAVAMAVQNLWLGLAELGLGGYWGSPAWMHHQSMSAFLGLQEGQTCLGFFYLGPTDSPTGPGERSPWQDKVRWF